MEIHSSFEIHHFNDQGFYFMTFVVAVGKMCYPAFVFQNKFAWRGVFPNALILWKICVVVREKCQYETWGIYITNATKNGQTSKTQIPASGQESFFPLI